MKLLLKFSIINDSKNFRNLQNFLDHERAYFLLVKFHMPNVKQSISRYHIQLDLSRINEFCVRRSIETRHIYYFLYLNISRYMLTSSVIYS